MGKIVPTIGYMARLLGIDVGTSGCKALLIDESGRVLRQAAAYYPLSTPRPGWSEQDPEDWWRGVCKVLAEIDEKRPDAIGLTGQMHGAVFLDQGGLVVRPAILWNDQRTAAECGEIDRTVGMERVREITRNPPLTGFQLPKLLWLRNNELSRYQAVRSVLLPKDYIRFRLTGQKATDVSDASGTGIFDVPRRVWSAEMQALLELDPSHFPEAFESDQIAGATNGVGGLDPSVPVVGGAGDQAAAAVGTGAVVPGVVSVCLGTSGVVFTSIDRPDFDPTGSAHTFCHANRSWHAMGVMLSCGGALRWYRDTCRAGIGYREIADEAASAPAGSNGITFLPYLAGERTPHNDPHVRGAWAGLSLSHSGNDLSRSVFEGATFGLADCMDALTPLGATAEEVRVTGGGARSDLWVQMLADVLGARCATLAVDEGPAFGAAMLAGVGIGVWTDVTAAASAVVHTTATIEPSGRDYTEARRRYRLLYRALRNWPESGSA